MEITKGAKEFLSEKGYDPKFGARPLKRAIQKYVEDPLAEEMLSEERIENSTIRIKMNASRDGLQFEWKEASSEDSSSEEEAKSTK